MTNNEDTTPPSDAGATKRGYAWEQWADKVAPVISVEGTVTPPSDAGATPNEVATPRTDKVLFVYKVYERQDGREYVSADFARTLERELAERDAEIAALKDGRTVILPKTQEHAGHMYTVAVAILKSFGNDPEQSRAATLAKLEASERLNSERASAIQWAKEEIQARDAKLTAAEQSAEHWQTEWRKQEEAHRLAEQQIAELTRDLAAARRDGERLQWLLARAKVKGGGDGADYTIAFHTPIDTECDIAALDAAMTANNQPAPAPNKRHDER